MDDVYDLVLNVYALVLEKRWPTVQLEECEFFIEDIDPVTVPDFQFCSENDGDYETN